MNEIKNKEFILISCGACLVIIMLILYFSGLNVAKGSYGAEDDMESSYECPAGYKLVGGDSCIPTSCNISTKKCSAICQKVGDIDCIPLHQATGGYSYGKKFTAKWNGRTCTAYKTYDSQDACKAAAMPMCECTYTDDLKKPATKKSSDPSPSPSPSPGNNKITIKFYNGNAMVKEESCVKGSCNSITAPGPQSITRSGYSFYNSSKEYEFTGWGSSSCLTTVGYEASYSAYHNFDNKSLAASASYYACYREKKTVEEPDNFDVNKCNFSQEFTVTYDVNYKNCKYINIGYNNSQSERTEANVKACCIAKGWTWVGYNFNSSGNDYEYCVKCGGGSSSPSSPSSPSNPSSPSIPSSTPSSTSSSSSDIDENPQTGSIAIFMVWVIALGALVYSFFYFKQSRFE